MGQILCVHKTNSYNIDLSFIFPFCRDTTNIDISFPLIWLHIFFPLLYAYRFKNDLFFFFNGKIFSNLFLELFLKLKYNFIVYTVN